MGPSLRRRIRGSHRDDPGREQNGKKDKRRNDSPSVYHVIISRTQNVNLDLKVGPRRKIIDKSNPLNDLKKPEVKRIDT